MTTKPRRHGFIWGLSRMLICMGSVLLLAVVLSGCAALSTTGENYAGVNYGEYIKPDGTRWKIAGGKDGTNVRFHAETRPDGTASVDLTADNYDATTVLAQANKAQQERIDALTSFILQRLAPTVPAP